MKLGHRRSSKITSPTPQSPSPQTMLIYNQTIPFRIDVKKPCHRKTVPPERVCHPPESRHGQVNLSSDFTTAIQCAINQVQKLSAASSFRIFQNIIPMPLNISPQTSLVYKQVISFMIEGWRQSHRKAVTSSCARETPESSRFGKILPRDFQRTLSMPHHPRP